MADSWSWGLCTGKTLVLLLEGVEVISQTKWLVALTPSSPTHFLSYPSYFLGQKLALSSQFLPSFRQHLPDSQKWPCWTPPRLDLLYFFRGWEVLRFLGQISPKKSFSRIFPLASHSPKTFYTFEMQKKPLHKYPEFLNQTSDFF